MLLVGQHKNGLFNKYLVWQCTTQSEHLFSGVVSGQRKEKAVNQGRCHVWGNCSIICRRVQPSLLCQGLHTHKLARVVKLSICPLLTVPELSMWASKANGTTMEDEWLKHIYITQMHVCVFEEKNKIMHNRCPLPFRELGKSVPQHSRGTFNGYRRLINPGVFISYQV